MQPIEGGLGFCQCGSEACDLDVKPLCRASAADPFDNKCVPNGTVALPACATPLLLVASASAVKRPAAGLPNLTWMQRFQPSWLHLRERHPHWHTVCDVPPGTATCQLMPLYGSNAGAPMEGEGVFTCSTETPCSCALEPPCTCCAAALVLSLACAVVCGRSWLTQLEDGSSF